MLKMTAKHFRYELTDESGYKFEVSAVCDECGAWTAHVAFSSFGFTSPDAALKFLTVSAKQFIRMVEEDESELGKASS